MLEKCKYICEVSEKEELISYLKEEHMPYNSETNYYKDEDDNVIIEIKSLSNDIFKQNIYRFYGAERLGNIYILRWDMIQNYPFDDIDVYDECFSNGVEL